MNVYELKYKLDVLIEEFNSRDDDILITIQDNSGYEWDIDNVLFASDRHGSRLILQLPEDAPVTSVEDCGRIR